MRFETLKMHAPSEFEDDSEIPFGPVSLPSGLALPFYLLNCCCSVRCISRLLYIRLTSRFFAISVVNILVLFVTILIILLIFQWNLTQL
jgi:hypothetical protein